MAVSEAAWIQGMTELGAIFPARDEDEAETTIRGQVYRREIQPSLTDHQWRHAVSEAIRMCEWFPPVVRLLEFGMAAPVMDVRRLAAPECPLCENTGFEPFERGGHAWVRFCPRGCRPGLGSYPPDYRTDEERREDNARGLALCLEELQRRGIDLKARTIGGVE